MELEPPPSQTPGVKGSLFNWIWIKWFNNFYEWAKENIVGNYAFEVARGNVNGVAAVQKFGRNQDIGSGTQEDIWDGGATWVAPAVARAHTVVSTSGSDAAGGVGARTIQVYGLTSWSTKEVSEVLIMDGTNNAINEDAGTGTKNSYVIIHRMKVCYHSYNG